MPKYVPRVTQLVFPRASKQELAQAVLEELGDDYFLYESMDFIEAIGPAIQKLLLQGKVVKISELGSFKIATSPERYYTDVNTKQDMLSHGSFKLKFVFVDAIRKKISTNLKKLMIQTMRLQADSVIEK